MVLVDSHQARASTARRRSGCWAFSMTSRFGLRAGCYRRPPHPADLVRQASRTTPREGGRSRWLTLSIAKGRAPAGGHVPLDPGRPAGPAGRPAAVDIAGAAPVEPMETTRPVDHATSPTSGTRAWRGRVRVPTVRNRRMQRGGRLQGRPAAAGQTGTAASLEATGAHSGSGRHRPGC
jgi:hypothetical protein